jgi:hypothetical protein
MGVIPTDRCLVRRSNYGEAEEAFLRTVVPPVEDRHLFTRAPWPQGAYRWFRSPNVVPIEKYRRPSTDAANGSA